MDMSAAQSSQIGLSEMKAQEFQSGKWFHRPHLGILSRVHQEGNLDGSHGEYQSCEKCQS